MTRQAAWLVLLSSLGSACACFGSPADASSSQQVIRDITPQEVLAHVTAKDAYIFDANTKEMFVEQHVPGARWIAYDGVAANALPQNRDALLIFYCAEPRCSASDQAAARAIELGWTKVRIMQAGIFGWVKGGLPVERG